MKKVIFAILVLLLIGDLTYSFFQYYHQPLDGDMAWNIVPADEVNTILKNPIGSPVWLRGDVYPNPNRFFSHWTYRQYMLKVPRVLQHWTDPITSVYLACALAKLLVHLSLLLVIGLILRGNKRADIPGVLVVAALISPLFQANGYYHSMGIIDASTTYTFFYAWPFVFLLVYAYPLIRQALGNSDRISDTWLFLSLPLCIPVCLSGPLNPGVILTSTVAVMMVSAFLWIRRDLGQRGSGDLKGEVMRYRRVFLYVLPAILISIYSLYLGSFNSLSQANPMPLTELFTSLPQGVMQTFFQKIGYPLLMASVMINLILVSRTGDRKWQVLVRRISIFILLFVVLYILLLPFGGYRPYRPLVVRYDTILPITILLVMAFGWSTWHLIKNLDGTVGRFYPITMAGILFVFMLADKPGFQRNDCEKEALQELSESDLHIVPLPYDCSILEWGRLTDPSASELNSELLRLWGITKEKKLYFNASEE